MGDSRDLICRPTNRPTITLNHFYRVAIDINLRWQRLQMRTFFLWWNGSDEAPLVLCFWEIMHSDTVSLQQLRNSTLRIYSHGLGIRTLDYWLYGGWLPPTSRYDYVCVCVLGGGGHLPLPLPLMMCKNLRDSILLSCPLMSMDGPREFDNYALGWKLINHFKLNCTAFEIHAGPADNLW